MSMRPGLIIGRIVLYRSRTGDYSCPAMVTATVDTLHQPNVDAGYIAGLSSPDHVHLTVFTPGRPGKRGTAEDFKVVSEHPIAENVGGLYQEWDIPFWGVGADAVTADVGARLTWPGEESPQPAGTWTWPPRV